VFLSSIQNGEAKWKHTSVRKPFREGQTRRNHDVHLARDELNLKDHIHEVRILRAKTRTSTQDLGVSTRTTAYPRDYLKT